MSRRPRQALMRLRCWHTRTSRWICRISCMGTTFNACVVDLEAAGAWRRRACNTRCAPPITCDRTWCCSGGSEAGGATGERRHGERGTRRRGRFAVQCHPPHSLCPTGDPQTGLTHAATPSHSEARGLLPCRRSTAPRDTAQHPATAARRERVACVAWRLPVPAALALPAVAPTRCLRRGCGHGHAAGAASTSPARTPARLPSPPRPAWLRGPAAVAAGVTTRHTHTHTHIQR